MIINKKTINPFEWNKFFAIKPVLVDDKVYNNENVKRNKIVHSELETVMEETYAFLQTVERRLETNMTGTRKWVYRLIQKD